MQKADADPYLTLLAHRDIIDVKMVSLAVTSMIHTRKRKSEETWLGRTSRWMEEEEKE